MLLSKSRAENNERSSRQSVQLSFDMPSNTGCLFFVLGNIYHSVGSMAASSAHFRAHSTFAVHALLLNRDHFSCKEAE